MYAIRSYYEASEEQRPFNYLEEDNNYKGFRAIAEKRLEFDSREIKLSLGNESFWESYNWQTFHTTDHRIELSDNHEKRSYTNFFGQVNYTSPRLRLSGGINLNTTAYNYRDLYTNDGDQSARHRFDPA